MITFQLFEDGRGFIGIEVVLMDPSRLNGGAEDVSDLFWRMLGEPVNPNHPSPHMQDMLRGREKVKWLLRHGIKFRVEAVVYDYLNFYKGSDWSEFHECINFRFTVIDPEDALLFKLTWGGA